MSLGIYTLAPVNVFLIRPTGHLTLFACLKVCDSGNLLTTSPSMKRTLRLELVAPLVATTSLASGRIAEAEHFSIAVERLPIVSS